MQPRDAFLERANQLHPVVELKFVLDSWRGLGGAAYGIGFRHLMYSPVVQSFFAYAPNTNSRERTGQNGFVTQGATISEDS
jgi:hypothetical protein